MSGPPTGNSRVFTLALRGVNAHCVNLLRRALLTKASSMCIDTVRLGVNTSALDDELLAHRLGLIPIKADPRHFRRRDDGGQGGDATIEFSLRAKCPVGTERVDVYSSNLVWEPRGVPSGFEEIGPADPDILIVRLTSGQEIDCECLCRKGRGEEHAQFGPVVAADYFPAPSGEYGEDRGVLLGAGPSTDNFVLSVEGTGAVSPLCILEEALRALEHGAVS